jgi:hypothetical protein
MPKVSLMTAIENLYAIQRENLVPSGLTGKAEADANLDLANREDRAYMAVARCAATTLQEFHEKLHIVLEANDLVERKTTGQFCGASPNEQVALAKSILRDAEKLFTTKGDEHLIALCDEHDATLMRVKTLNKQCRDDELPDDHESQLAALLDQQYKALYAIIRIRPKTLMGAARMAQVLPYHVKLEAGMPCDDRIERFVAKLTEGLSAVCAPSLPIEFPVPLEKAA